MRLSVAIAVACLSLTALSTAAEVEAAVRKVTNIPAQGLGPALQTLAQQRDFQVVYLSEAVDQLHTQGAIGEFTAEEALTKLLSGTGLAYRYLDEDTVTIFPLRAGANSSSGDSEGSGSPAASRSSDATAAGGASPAADGNGGAAESGQQATSPADAARGGPSSPVPRSPDQQRTTVELEEIVVTGTHIRGAGPIGSPLIVLDREDIRTSGYSRVQDFLETLPQNFQGSANEFVSYDQGSNNLNRGEAIDLRGIGASSTLVLINGRRQPSGGVTGSFVDISSIASSAVERVEVLTDGASALYGADAIGGVVNFVLRKDYDGAESDVRFGSMDGDAPEWRASQLFGQSWSGGNVLVGYQFSRRDAHMKEDAFYSSRGDNLTEFGGSDFRSAFSNPGNILNASFRPAFAIPAGQDGTDLSAADLIPGQNYRDSVTQFAALPEQTQHSAFFALSQALGDRFELFAEGRYSQRDMELLFGGFAAPISVPSSNPFYVNPFGTTAPVNVGYDFRQDLGPLTQVGDIETYTATVGTVAQLGGQWEVNAALSYGREENSWEYLNNVNMTRAAAAAADSNPATALNLFGDGSNTNPATLDFIRETMFSGGDFTVSSITAVADGPVLDLPAGAAKLAVGVDYREEELGARGGTLAPSTGVVAYRTTAVGELDRQVSAAFAELVVPVLTNGRGAEQLTVSLAGRYEDYSDFGTTFNPKFGIRFVPVDGLTVRGSWGTSFRAPRFNELSQSSRPSRASARLNTPDPRSPTGQSVTISLTGANPDLREETATTWTAGVDFAAPSLPALSLSATYFDLVYNDKIQIAGSGATTLQRESEWVEIITRDPTQEQVNAICNSPAWRGGTCPTNVAAIIDERIRNIGEVHLNGIDLQASYRFDTGAGAVILGLAGTHTLVYERANSPQAPSIDILDTPTFPLDLRLRGSVSWQVGRCSAAAFVNYSDDYRDPALNRPVGSWTTVDTSVSYRFADSGWLRGANVLLSAVNVLDKEPPFVNTWGFDAANANEDGRMIGLSLLKRW